MSGLSPSRYSLAVIAVALSSALFAAEGSADSLISIRVQDASENPIEGAEIYSGDKLLGRTGSDGRFEKDGPSGDLTIRVKKHCHRTVEIEHHCSSGSICSIGRTKLELMHGGIALAVSSPAVGPLDGAEVSVKGGRGGTTNKQGGYRENLQCGHYKLSVSKGGFDTVTKEVDVRDGDVSLNLALKARFEKLVVVTNPADGASVVLANPAGKALQGQDLEGGAGKSYSVPWGTYKLAVSADGLTPFAMDIPVIGETKVAVPPLVPADLTPPAVSGGWTSTVAVVIAFLCLALLGAGLFLRRPVL